MLGYPQLSQPPGGDFQLAKLLPQHHVSQVRSTRLIQQQDKIVKPSKERPFFVMQQLRIGGEDVLTFYDSGANVHLVEGALAERVGFTILDNKCVSIGVVGGGQVWS